MGVKISEKRAEELRNEGKYFLTEVSSKQIEELMKWMAYGISHGKRYFTLLISSAGGSPSWTVHFASFLRMVPDDVHLHGVAISECGSAALAILQFCHKRSAVRHTAFYPHHVQVTLEVNCQQPMAEIVAYVEREIAQARMLEQELVSIQSARMSITPEQWMQIAEYGEKLDGGIKYLTDDALRLGMIDEVIEHYPLFG